MSGVHILQGKENLRDFVSDLRMVGGVLVHWWCVAGELFCKPTGGCLHRVLSHLLKSFKPTSAPMQPKLPNRSNKVNNKWNTTINQIKK